MLDSGRIHFMHLRMDEPTDIRAIFGAEQTSQQALAAAHEEWKTYECIQAK